MAMTAIETEHNKRVNAYLYGNRRSTPTNLYTEGVWLIFGEDPNCDLGGIHRKPLLATVSGQFIHAVHYAVELLGFYAWGSGCCGGCVTALKPPEIKQVFVDSWRLIIENHEKKEKKEKIEQEIAKLKEQLAGL